MINQFDIWTANIDDDNKNTQQGTRPVVILKYFKELDKVLIAPITTKIKTIDQYNMPTHIILDKSTGLEYDSICKLEHIKNISSHRLVNKKSVITDKYLRYLIEAAGNVSLGIDNDYIIKHIEESKRESEKLLKKHKKNEIKLTKDNLNQVNHTIRECRHCVKLIVIMSRYI